jgi:hypothetical protein
MAKVVIRVNRMITIPSSVFVPTIRQVIKVPRVIKATLTKLLKIRMVASSFLGSLIRAKIIFSDCWGLFLQLAISFLDNEKKATSDPEIMADVNSKRARTNPPRK